MRSGLLAALLGQGGAAPPSGYDVVIDGWLSGIAAAGGSISSNNAAAWNAVIAGARTAG